MAYSVLFALETFLAQDKFYPSRHTTPSFVVAMRALLALFVAGAAAVSVDELSKWFESAEGAIETASVGEMVKSSVVESG